MEASMTREPAIVDFQKTIGPGVVVRIVGIPAEVLRKAGHDDLNLFDQDTAGRVLRLLRLARTQMANGETDIRFDFAQTA